MDLSGNSNAISQLKQNVTATSAGMIGTRIQQRLCDANQLRKYFIPK